MQIACAVKRKSSVIIAMASYHSLVSSSFYSLISLSDSRSSTFYFSFLDSPFWTELIISCVFSWSETSYSILSLNLSLIPLCFTSADSYSYISTSDLTCTCELSLLLGSCRLLNFFLNCERYPPYSSSLFSCDT